MSDALAKAARDELFRRIMRLSDLYEQSFDDAARGFGLTTEQIELLKQEQRPQIVEETPEYLELKRRIAQGLWIEDKDAPRADSKERVFLRRCPKCGHWAKTATSGHEPIVTACMSAQCWIDAGMPD